MPNWCATSYRIDGSKSQCDKLYQLFQQTLAEKSLDASNEASPRWLGHIVEALGADPKKIPCRGFWEDIDYRDGVISLFVESAWAECSGVRQLLEERFPEVTIYYQSEELGCEIFQSNDALGIYFPDQYLLQTDEDTYYFCKLADLIAAVREITGESDLQTFDDCREALRSWSDNQTGKYAITYECDYVE